MIKLLLLATIALASPEREYWTDRPDELGAYMRCASEAFNDDPSIGQSEALDRIKVECRPLRDQAIEIFRPLYRQRMQLHETIPDTDIVERTILGAVLAEQMRKEEEAMMASPESNQASGAPPIRIIPRSNTLGAQNVCIQPADDDDAIRQIVESNGLTIRVGVDETCHLILLSNRSPKVRLPQIYSAGELRTINSASCISDYRPASPGFAGAAATYYLQQEEGSRLACMVELLALRDQG